MSSVPSLYVDRDTILHRIDPRAELALLLAVFTAVYVFNHPAIIAVPLIVTILALVSIGGLRNLRRVWFIVVALFVGGLVIWPGFTDPRGPMLFETPLVSLSRYQLLFALGRSERIATYILGGLVFVTSTSNEELVTALRSMGVPFAVSFAVGAALRLFPTFLSATGTVRQAQQARGHEVSGGNPIERVRSFVPLLIPIFMTAIRQVETQSMALEARGFDPSSERTFYNRRTFDARDWVATALGLGLTVVFVALSLAGVGSIA